jgi:caspase domain-containing protein
MKRIAVLSLLALFLFVLASGGAAAKNRGIRIVSKSGEGLYPYKDYHALVVGVSDYEKWPHLPNGVKDAKDVAERLEELGFRVKLVTDPTHEEMNAALNYLSNEIGRTEDRAILFYYAGHGETQVLPDGSKMGFIIPRDCPDLKKDYMGFVRRAVSMEDIESASRKMKSKHVLMLFDSCLSLSGFSLLNAVPKDITEESVLPVRQYITAGRENEKIPRESMFKRWLLLGLLGDADMDDDDYVTGSELGMYLRENVFQDTLRQQKPQYAKSDDPDLSRGDFILVPLKERQRQEAEKAAALAKAKRQEAERVAAEAKAKRQEAERVAALEERKRQEVERKRKEDLERQKKAFEAEQAKLEAQRKALEEERRRLEAEHKALEKRALEPAAEREAPKKEVKKSKVDKEGPREPAKKEKKRVINTAKSDEEKINELYEKSRMLIENPSLAREIYTPDAVREITNPFGKTRTISGLQAIMDDFERQKSTGNISDREEISREIEVKGDKTYLKVLMTANIVRYHGKCEMILTSTLVRAGNDWRVKHVKVVIK